MGSLTWKGQNMCKYINEEKNQAKKKVTLAETRHWQLGKLILFPLSPACSWKEKKVGKKLLKKTNKKIKGLFESVF